MFEFDPSIDGPTPEHVRWTLVHDCPLRAGTDISNPDQTERLLRSVQLAGDAILNKTKVGSVILRERADTKEILAFDKAQSFAPFGGENAVQQCCHDCPVNIGRPKYPATCFGVAYLPVERERRDAVLRMVDEPKFDSPVANRWHRAWIDWENSPTKLKFARDMVRILRREPKDRDLLTRQESRPWAIMQCAIALAMRLSEFRLNVSVHPAGVTRGRSWQVDPHCIRCKASWWDERKKTCKVCGNEGGRQSSRTRKRIGTRPFRPLSEFVSADQIPAIIQQWRASVDEDRQQLP